MDLRCVHGILHGAIVDGFLEVSCRSARCGKRPGNIVLHRFDINTGDLVSTKVFQQPKEVSINGNRSEQGSALWIA